MLDTVHPKTFLPGFSLEGFANRDSVIYKKLYGIPEASTVLRGTLRFEGFATAMKALHKLHLIDQNPHPILHPKGPDMNWVKIILLNLSRNYSWKLELVWWELQATLFQFQRQLICHMLGQIDTNIFYENLKNMILKEFDGDFDQVDAIEGLGLLEEVPVFKLGSPLDTLSHFLSKKLAFGMHKMAKCISYLN